LEEEKLLAILRLQRSKAVELGFVRKTDINPKTIVF
jgi:hypothetical protein